MRVLVTGTEGYLGALLAPVLMEAGHEVTGLDTGYYRAGYLFNADGDVPRTIVKDIRRVSIEDLEGHEAVVHMAELSNDPLGALDPHITYEINHKGTVHLAKTAKAAGVRRLIYMSSCSVYGVADDGDVTEEATPNPQTAYGVCKTLCERDLRAMGDGDFSVCCFRNATAFGASPRQRFDLVLNNLCGLAWTTKEIRMICDGSPWRPLVHGLDIAKAIRCALAAPREAIDSQIFNIGSNSQNYRVREIAEKVKAVFPDCAVSFGTPSKDNRSYRVCFDKVRRGLPGFECEWDAEKGVRQMYDLFQQIGFSAEDFERPAFTRLKQLQHLIRTKQIDEKFYWKVSF